MDQMNGWSAWNDYGRLIYSLFKPSTPVLDDRFSVINFNYDGLFGKLLTDAVLQRCEISHYDKPSRQRLAALAGGFYPENEFRAVVAGASHVLDFNHYMPHGTITALKGEDGVLALQDAFYTQKFTGGLGSRSDMEAWFLIEHYRSEPLIHFPWEPDSCHPTFERQHDESAVAVGEARRLHFIGLSGHPLLGATLKKVFSAVEKNTVLEGLLEKEWHIATIDPNPGRVFENIVRCFLPQKIEFSEFMAGFQDRERKAGKKVFFYKGFSEWLDEKPHYNMP